MVRLAGSLPASRVGWAGSQEPGERVMLHVFLLVSVRISLRPGDLVG